MPALASTVNIILTRIELSSSFKVGEIPQALVVLFNTLHSVLIGYKN